MKGGNYLKTVVLLGVLTGLLLVVGYLIGGPQGLTVGLIFAGLMNFGSYWFSDKIVLAMYRAQEVTETEAPKLHTIVNEVIMRANVPKPKVYIIPGNFANAFATGRNPKHAAVAVTKGILELLNEHELKGVIAHEIAHIKNRDILTSTIAATIAGVISYVAFMARWAAIFGGGRDNDNNMFELLALAIVTPLTATMIQLAISRSREYAADASAAHYLHDGSGLASALHKLHESVKTTALRPTGQTNATAHMFIANPFRGKTLFNLFSTHPDYRSRIERLQNIKY